ncbi:MAG TPA: esterase-like activity of phytase family protein [Microlunatus sp.]
MIISSAALAAAVCVAAAAPVAAHPPSETARDDAYTVRAGRTLTVSRPGVTRNDHGRPATLVAHSLPSHGSLKINSDGSFRYTPEVGFTGRDSFDYTVSDAVSLYRSELPPLATVGGIAIGSSAYGSSIAPVPQRRGVPHHDEYYGLTDRGPNVDGPTDNVKIEPVPDFHPAIGRFRFVNGKAVLIKKIELRAADGTPYNGQVNPEADTGETIEGLDGRPLPTSTLGYDPEGLVALPDGTFWVSDEYGPYITHFAADGRALERLSPSNGSLPAELAKREVNKGMEGLTITPDGSTLVGIMQSALHQDDLAAKVKNVAPVRIVTVDLRTHQTHEYLYLLDDPDQRHRGQRDHRAG